MSIINKSDLGYDDWMAIYRAIYLPLAKAVGTDMAYEMLSAITQVQCPPKPTKGRRMT